MANITGAQSFGFLESEETQGENKNCSRVPNFITSPGAEPQKELADALVEKTGSNSQPQIILKQACKQRPSHRQAPQQHEQQQQVSFLDQVKNISDLLKNEQRFTPLAFCTALATTSVGAQHRLKPVMVKFTVKSFAASEAAAAARAAAGLVGIPEVRRLVLDEVNLPLGTLWFIGEVCLGWVAGADQPENDVVMHGIITLTGVTVKHPARISIKQANGSGMVFNAYVTAGQVVVKEGSTIVLQSPSVVELKVKGKVVSEENVLAGAWVLRLVSGNIAAFLYNLIVAAGRVQLTQN